MTPDLTSLIERVEGGVGPDMALARAVMTTVGGWHRITPTHARNRNGAYIAPEDWLGRTSGGSPILDSMHGTTMHRDVPDVVTSLDAVLALIEAKLPGWFGDVDLGATTPDSGGLYGARLFPPNEKNGFNIAGEATSPARALLAATLRVLQESRNADR